MKKYKINYLVLAKVKNNENYKLLEQSVCFKNILTLNKYSEFPWIYKDILNKKTYFDEELGEAYYFIDILNLKSHKKEFNLIELKELKDIAIKSINSSNQKETKELVKRAKLR